ncbi:MAG: CDP-diacylglycerol--serine O-phosphatidyltransferase [Deltaproteobacteria bacterium]|jgi:CDP-diacylglycerol--serine O-phosphatidyltransferase|nr:CDP-diacylglycerol--serine O-phosphatidyltransferase [Deltaproteobacteria bacterium]
MSQKRKKRSKERRAIYLLPNLFTTFSLFAGFLSMVSSMQGRFQLAAWAILAASLLDTLDGTVARMTNTTSRFGTEYDSLCDLLSFGAAPAVLVYQWALKPSKLAIAEVLADEKTFSLGMVVAFIFLACAALRLARFNVSAGQRDPGFFQGLPSTGGAAIMSAMVLWHFRPAAVPAAEPNHLFVLCGTLAIAFLMVSTLDYFSLKNKLITKNNHPFETLVLIILILGAVIIKAKTLLLPIAIVYLAAGPIVTLVRRRRKAGAPGSEDPGAPARGDPEGTPEKTDAPASPSNSVSPLEDGGAAAPREKD